MFISALHHYRLIRLKRSTFETTETELKLMAAPAMTGLIGSKIQYAIGNVFRLSRMTDRMSFVQLFPECFNTAR